MIRCVNARTILRLTTTDNTQRARLASKVDAPEIDRMLW